MKISDRHLEILNFVAANPDCSTNKVYIGTSPICQSTGRTRSMGTSGWTIPDTLKRKGLITIKKIMPKNTSYHNTHLVRYYWNLTKKGRNAIA